MSVPGASNPLLLSSAAGGAAGYEIERSLRINSPDAAYLDRTMSAGNQKTWTWSGWVKRSALSGSDLAIFTGRGASATLVRFKNNNLDFVVSGLTHRRSTAKFRDHSAWYHFVWAVDTTQATPADRSRFYVNGIEITTEWDIDNALTLDQLTDVNAAGVHLIGASDTVPNDKLDAYIADFYLIDGQQLTATDFGEFDATTGAWNPIAYSGTYPGNSFHLDFSDNSSASALGTDSSGNGNDWTVNSIGVPGTYTFSNGWTANLLPGFPGTNCFNGTGTSLTIGGSSVVSTWTAPTTLPFSTLIIRGAHDGATIRINGIDVTSQFTSGLSIVNVTGVSSPLSTIDLDGSSGAGNPRISSIVIDGERLVDSRPYPGQGNDSLRDSPTNGDTANDTGLGGQVPGNYCTWNALANAEDATLSNGNLDIAYGSLSTRKAQQGTFGMTSGKWYWEVSVTAANTLGALPVLIGIANSPDPSVVGSYPGSTAASWSYYGGTGDKYTGGLNTAYGDTWVIGDVIGVALDIDNGNLYFYKNGTIQNGGTAAFTGLTTGPYFPSIGDGSAAGTFSASTNFGQRAFVTSVPAGYKSLCTANLTPPTIAKPREYMDVLLWTGDDAPTRDITGLSFQPELVWLKSRSVNNDHNLFDSVRGAENTLSSNSTAVEVNQPIHGWVSNFISGGFSVTGGSLGDVNYLSRTYVAWNWDAGTGSPVSNTDGTITSSVQANASAGFSIVTYTGVGYTTVNDNFTVGHGLGVKPAMVIIKKRSSTTGFWPVWHTAYGDPAASGTNTQYILLNSNAAQGSLGGGYLFKDASTADVFGIGVGSEVNGSGSTFVAYCFAPVAQYSAFGSYIGNGSTDGTFIYTGFRPRWIMLKRSSAGGNGSNWIIYDTVRSTYNLNDTQLIADSSVLENQDNTGSSTAGLGIDILSNGFKQKSNSGGRNNLGDTYIYAAFAESPFSYSRAR